MISGRHLSNEINHGQFAIVMKAIGFQPLARACAQPISLHTPLSSVLVLELKGIPVSVGKTDCSVILENNTNGRKRQLDIHSLLD